MMNGFNFGTVPPSFIIIGVQKGGTSSLYHYLTQHPKLIAPMIKELHYFDTFNPTPKADYLQYFPKKYFTSQLAFEATPRYISFPGTAKKIFDFNPKMKFILLLRDPAKRAFSAWNMYRQMSEDTSQVERSRRHQIKNPLERTYSFFYEGNFPSFDEWIETETGVDFPSDILEPSIVKRGYYKEQIECYLEYFKINQFHFIDFQDFQSNTVSVLNGISEFLGISGFDTVELSLEIKNERSYENKLSPQLYAYLLKHYREKNEGLEKLINLELSWMSD